MCYYNNKKVGVFMNAVNKTLYIPLYCKSFVSKRGIILSDKKAEQICAEVDFELSKDAKSKWLCYYMAMRSKVFDDWTLSQMNDHTDAVVIHIGCGLDCRISRLGSSHHPWYDIDFPDVIMERMKYFHQTIDYSMLEADATDNRWLDILPHDKDAIIIMEGISMYIDNDKFKSLIKRLAEHFEKLHLLVDCYTEFGASASKHKNPVNSVGVNEVFGLDDPLILTQGTGVTFVREHEITPKHLVDELRGVERFIFKHIYAGVMSKRIYRMYEYIK